MTIRILGAIFILSSLSKAINVAAFATETRLYLDAYFWDGMHSWDVPLSVTICAIELTVGLLSLHARYARIGNAAMTAILTFFVWLTAVNAFWPTPFGSIESCGCFGELIHFTPLASFVKSAVLWAMSLVALVGQCRAREPWNLGALLHDRFTLLALIAGLALPTFSLLALEQMGHEVYLAAFLMLCGAEAFGAWKMARVM